MPYRVELSARAERDLEILYLEKQVEDSGDAARWYNGLEKAVLTLGRMPGRCPVIPEAEKTKRQVRHLLYGRKPHVYRICFEIDEARRIVYVLTIRHGARRAIRKKDLI